MLFVYFFKAAHHFLHIIGIKIGVAGDALFLFHRVQLTGKMLALHFHHNAGEHLNKAAVGVVGEALVAGEFGQAFNSHIVKAQVEDGVHHARHGGAGA